MKAMAHPHLSQALLGTPSASTSNSNKDSNSTLITQQSGQSSTSLIKSLLATKVNDCMTTTVSMKTATDCQNVAQVTPLIKENQLIFFDDSFQYFFIFINNHIVIQFV